MRLDERRKVIEVLLCAGGDANNVSASVAAEVLALDHDALTVALDESYELIPIGTVRFGHRMMDAAYRLIETSPTLRREWFGAR